MNDLAERLGICQWFHFDDDRAVEACAGLMQELGLKHLRTGVSWADYHRPGGVEWYDRMFAALRPFELLLSVWHTPPSLSVSGHCAAPPRRLLDYADFIDTLIDRYGTSFSALELWNEPNNRYKWQFDLHDPDWSKFAEMVGSAAYWAKQRGVTTVLGGMMPVDEHWLHLIAARGVLDVVDIVAIHGFPGMWWNDLPNWDWYSHWSGWSEKLARIGSHAARKPVWITETGFSTWSYRESREVMLEQQRVRLAEAVTAPSPRTYWYSLVDLDPSREAIEGFHVDENEYHLGLVTHQGKRKPAFYALKEMLTRPIANADFVPAPAAR